jgi:serine/threonine-protein kinase
MLTESEKRAALLAVSRFGADRAKVRLAVQAALQAMAQGKPADLLEILVRENLLTPNQAAELRFSLDKTMVDPASPKVDGEEVKPNGSNPVRQGNVQTEVGELRVLGEYRLLRQLGEGGMGKVWLGYQEGERRQVAIKILPNSLAANQGTLDRFYREAKSGLLLNHPNIVRNITVGQDRASGQHYLVLEFVDGPSALALLERFGKLPVGDAVHVVLDIARGLEHAHSRNIVHRDIKPANILISPSGVAKLADLGLAKRTDETSHLTAARQGFGTPYYMPYEQAMNAKYADGRSDIYALGATLYHLLTGQVPFAGATHLEIVDKKKIGDFTPASSLCAQVPSLLDEILEKMLARDPKDRYQTASELIVDLERANLSAQVPSFVDRDLAMQDPLVRQRLTSPAQPTCPDLQMGEAASPEQEAIWYLRYTDRHGQACKVKGTLEDVLKRLEDGKIPIDAEASHRPQVEFLPLADFHEFQAVVKRCSARAKALFAPTQPDLQAPGYSWPLVLSLAAGLGILILAAVIIVFLGR